MCWSRYKCPIWITTYRFCIIFSAAISMLEGLCHYAQKLHLEVNIVKIIASSHNCWPQGTHFNCIGQEIYNVLVEAFYTSGPWFNDPDCSSDETYLLRYIAYILYWWLALVLYGPGGHLTHLIIRVSNFFFFFITIIRASISWPRLMHAPPPHYLLSSSLQT